MLDRNNIVWDELYKEYGNIHMSCHVTNVRYWYDSAGLIIATFTIDTPIVVGGVMYREFLLSKFTTYNCSSRMTPELYIDDLITIRIEARNSSIEIHERVSGSLHLCPMCKSLLLPRYMAGEHIGRCLSKSCPGTMTYNVTHFIETMGILRAPFMKPIIALLLTRGAMLNPVQLFYLQEIDIAHPDIPAVNVFEFINDIHAIRGRYFDDKCSVVLRALNIYGLSETFYCVIDHYFKTHGLGLMELLRMIEPGYFQDLESSYYDVTTGGARVSTMPIGNDPGATYESDMLYWQEYLSHPANRDTFAHMVNILMT